MKEQHDPIEELYAIAEALAAIADTMPGGTGYVLQLLGNRTREATESLENAESQTRNQALAS